MTKSELCDESRPRASGITGPRCRRMTPARSARVQSCQTRRWTVGGECSPHSPGGPCALNERPKHHGRTQDCLLRFPSPRRSPALCQPPPSRASRAHRPRPTAQARRRLPRHPHGPPYPRSIHTSWRCPSRGGPSFPVSTRYVPTVLPGLLSSRRADSLSALRQSSSATPASSRPSRT